MTFSADGVCLLHMYVCVGCKANASKLATAEILTCSSRLIKACVCVCAHLCVADPVTSCFHPEQLRRHVSMY